MVTCWGTRGQDVNTYILGVYSAPHNRSLTSSSGGERGGAFRKIWKRPRRSGCWCGTAQGEPSPGEFAVWRAHCCSSGSGKGKLGVQRGRSDKLEPQTTSVCLFEHLLPTLNFRASWRLLHFRVHISGHFTFGNFNPDHVRKGILENIVLNIIKLLKEQHNTLYITLYLWKFSCF